METLITQLMGGLGNQMFQYAAGRRLSLEKNRRLLVDKSILDDHSPGRHDVNRKYGLQVFKLEVQTARNSDRWLFNAHGLPWLVRVLKRLLEPVTSRWTYRNRSFEYDKDLFEAVPIPRYIQGLWQSYKYLEPISKQLRQDFQFRNALNTKTQKIAESLQKKYAVCLHVRRGDYISGKASSFMSMVGREYYQIAIQNLEKKFIKKLTYHVFSDDIEWCKREFTWLGFETIFNDSNLSLNSEGVDLHLMSLASLFVIPNSTFAWWAAWLAKAPDKHVIAPARWFIDSTINTQELCPPEWIRI